MTTTQGMPFGWNAEAVTAWAAMLTALIALAAALFARAQVREARTLREEQAQPFVIVDIEPSPNAMSFLELVVSNIGNTLARDVTFHFDPPLRRAWKPDMDPNDWSIFKDGIPSFPPGRSFRMLFDIGHERHSAGYGKDRHTVTVTFKGPRGQELEPLTYILDPAYIMEPNRLGVRTVHHVAEHLDKIAKRMERWSRHDSLRVLSYDGDALAAREIAEEEEYQRQRREAIEKGQPEPDPFDD